MSMYTKLKLCFEKSLPVTVKEELNNLIKHNCGINDYNHSRIGKIDFHLTYNYGLEKVVKIIKLVEKVMDYSNPTIIGTFESENMYSDYPSTLYGYNGHLLAVEMDTEFGYGFTLNHYKISDLCGNMKVYTKETNDENDKIIQQILDEFLKSELRR